MSKPLIYKCTMYCDIHPCSRVECNRKPLFKYGQDTIMIEPKEYNYYRTKEKMRLYIESRTTHVNS